MNDRVATEISRNENFSFSGTTTGNKEQSMRAMKARGFNGYGDLQRVNSEDLLRTPAEVIAAVHNNTLMPDARLNALVNLVKEPVRVRGYAKKETIEKFLAAGYKKEQVTELLLGIALKTMQLIPFGEKRNTALRK